MIYPRELFSMLETKKISQPDLAIIMSISLSSANNNFPIALAARCDSSD